MKRSLFPLIFLIVASSNLAADTVIEEIIARVNGAIITRSDLERARNQLEAEIKQSGITDPKERARREADLLRDLIDQQLLIQKAGDVGITGDTELIRRLDDIRKSMNLASLEELERAATQQGVDFEEFKQNLKNGILTQATIGQQVGRTVKITQEEERQYYEEHKSEMERPEQVRLSEILISTEKPAESGTEANKSAPDPATVAAAEKKAQEALAAIKAGTSFEEVAKKYSDGPSAAQGGDLGLFKRGMLAKELEDKTFDQMKAGDVSEVIATRQGFVILKVTEHQKPGVPAFNEVQPRIQETLYMRKLQPALRQYLTKLREEAFIDIKPGFVDTGASPKQSKPVMAAADERGSDKEPEKKKKRFLIF